jgi:hypothetical protein
MPKNKPSDNHLYSIFTVFAQDGGEGSAICIGCLTVAENTSQAASYKIIVYWYSIQVFYIWQKYHTCMSLSTAVG